MTIQEAIEKAIEGGYPKGRVADLAVPVQAQCFLETSFWESLGRTLGWEGDFEYITLRGDEPHKVRQPMWLYYWHRFHCIPHLKACAMCHREHAVMLTERAPPSSSLCTKCAWTSHSQGEHLPLTLGSPYCSKSLPVLCFKGRVLTNDAHPSHGTEIAVSRT
jgi:hypothetical protein